MGKTRMITCEVIFEGDFKLIDVVEKSQEYGLELWVDTKRYKYSGIFQDSYWVEARMSVAFEVSTTWDESLDRLRSFFQNFGLLCTISHEDEIPISYKNLAELDDDTFQRIAELFDAAVKTNKIARDVYVYKYTIYVTNKVDFYDFVSDIRSCSSELWLDYLVKVEGKTCTNAIITTKDETNRAKCKSLLSQLGEIIEEKELEELQLYYTSITSWGSGTGFHNIAHYFHPQNKLDK